MNTDEFNSKLAELLKNFLEGYMLLINKFNEESEMDANHKLTLLLYSHLGIERALSTRIWKIGSQYMDAVIEIGKEFLNNERSET